MAADHHHENQGTRIMNYEMNELENGKIKFTSSSLNNSSNLSSSSPSPSSSLPMMALSSSSSLQYQWKFIICDILWDYVYSKFLNTWLVVIAILYTLTFATSYLIPDIHWNHVIERWFMSVVSILFIIFFAIFGTAIIIPLSFANSPYRFNFWYNRIGIFFFPLISAVLFTIFWIYYRNQSHQYFAFVSWLLGILGSSGCFIYCCHILLRKTDAYVDRKVMTNRKYVQNLLQKHEGDQKSEVFNNLQKNQFLTQVSYYLHPIYKFVDGNQVINTTSTVKINSSENKFPYHEPFVYPDRQVPVNSITDESTLTHFFSTFDWRRVLYEIRKDTPQLLMLGTLLGYVVVAVMLGYAFTVFWVTITWNDVWHVFQRLTDPIETFVVSMNDFVQAWNTLKSEIPSWIRNETQKKLFENNTEAIDNLNHYLAELGFNITYDDIKQFEYAAKNVTDSADEVIWAYSEFYSWYDNFKNGFLSFKDEYEELRWSWNYSLLACAIIVSLIALASLLWPILVSCNIRRNLRSGKWRHNKRAYVSKYRIHHLAYVPGMQFGTALMTFLVYLVLLSVIVFLLVYTPSRDLLWSISRDFFFTLVFALLLKEAIVYFIFVKWQLDPEGNMKDIQTYSISFCIFLIFNILYGILASIFRMLIFIGFSFLAILRIDATMLPDEVKELDQGYYSFHSYLMFEHETKNPILRTAIELFLEGGKQYALRGCRVSIQRKTVARNRWFLAYTLISNPSLIPLRRRKLKEDSMK